MKKEPCLISNMKRRFLPLLSIWLLYGFRVMVSAKGENLVEAKIPVSCIAKECEESFEYVLRQENDAFQTAEQYELKLLDGETGYFRVCYFYPGTYHCSVYQKEGVSEDIIYDKRVYTVSVFVTEDEKGNMHAKPIVFPDKSEHKSTACEFVNKKETTERTTSIPQTPDTVQKKSVQTGDPYSPETWLAVGIFALVVVRTVCNKKKGGSYPDEKA